MTYSELIRVSRAGVTTLRLNRPAKRNAVHPRLVNELRAALGELSSDDTCRVLLIDGADPFFCAGADMSAFKTSATASDSNLLAEYALFEQSLTSILQFPKPVIAAVQGGAIGYGCGLVAACDVVHASEDAMFGMPELRYGIVPGSVLNFLLRRVGYTVGLRWMLECGKYTAQEALRVGLVDVVVPRERLATDAMAYAQRIASLPPQAVADTKRAALAWASGADSAAERYAASLASLRLSMKTGSTP